MTALLVVILSGSSVTSRGTASMSKLHLEQIVADSASVDAVAVLAVGPTEILLWDAQYHTGDARRIADQVTVAGKPLKAIVISHPDLDHYLGASTIVERFPGTPVYVTAVTLEEFNRTAPKKPRKQTPPWWWRDIKQISSLWSHRIFWRSGIVIYRILKRHGCHQRALNRFSTNKGEVSRSSVIEFVADRQSGGLRDEMTIC